MSPDALRWPLDGESGMGGGGGGGGVASSLVGDLFPSPLGLLLDFGIL